MLSPEYLASVSDDFIELYAQVERDITADVARRIMKTGYVTKTAKWQIERAKEIGMFQDEVAKILSSATGLSKPAIKKLLTQAAYTALETDNEIYALAGLDTVIDFTKSDTMKAILLQGISDTQRLMKNFTKTTATTARKALENALDRAYLQIMSGAFTREQAIKNAVTDLATKGITRIAYESGSTISVEGGIRRAVTTGLNQTCSKLQLERAKELGSDLVEVSSHMGARPTHAVWQGGIYSISGKHPRYRELVESTGYGSGDGLCGWNCYHNFFPYLEGYSTPVSEKIGNTAANAKAYEESQKQRYYERQVRDAKRRVATYEGAISGASTDEERSMFNDKLQDSKRLVRARQKRLRDFCKETGRRQDYSRTYTTGYNKPYKIG